jgi:K+-sensing histidine kinase KdpD
MKAAKGAVPFVVSLAVMIAATIVLWRLKISSAGSERLIYLYLLPIIFIAILYTGRLAMLCTVMALVFADYFLQDPLYSLANSNPLEYGDLICFAVLAGISIKCIRVLMRPRAKIVEQGPRYRRT